MEGSALERPWAHLATLGSPTTAAAANSLLSAAWGATPADAADAGCRGTATLAGACPETRLIGVLLAARSRSVRRFRVMATSEAAPPEPYTMLLRCPLVRAGTPGSCSLHIDYGRQHDRKPHRDDERNLGGAWLAATEKNPRIFDGSKFRLHRIALDAHDHVVLELGLTGYREYLGTNRLPTEALRQLEADGRAEHADPRAHLSDALGCETILLTADDQVVLLRRSSSVATHSGLHNGPSGHPEPSRAGVDNHGVQGAAAAAAVVRELYDSVLQETHEETAVPRDALSEPQLIGCMADGVGKPDLLFLTRTTLDADGVRACYSQGPEEGWESDRLVFWPAQTLTECTLALTPVTRAAIACFVPLRE